MNKEDILVEAIKVAKASEFGLTGIKVEFEAKFNRHLSPRTASHCAARIMCTSCGDSVIRNFKHGSTFMYPQDFNHKKTLRNLSKKAVMCLGLDFGAVDIIWKDDKWYVLEVNSAPSLTSNSDILQRYVKAFKELSEDV